MKFKIHGKKPMVAAGKKMPANMKGKRKKTMNEMQKAIMQAGE